jgi:hypothetical protein
MNICFHKFIIAATHFESESGEKNLDMDSDLYTVIKIKKKIKLIFVLLQNFFCLTGSSKHEIFCFLITLM